MPAHSEGQASLAETLASATVMMVDDEPITLDIVQAYLEDAGYRNFVTVSEPETVLPIFVSKMPDVLLKFTPSRLYVTPAPDGEVTVICPVATVQFG